MDLKNCDTIIIKRNKDKTYNATIKYDAYDKLGIKLMNGIEINYPRVILVNLDIDVLADKSNNLFYMKIKKGD